MENIKISDSKDYFVRDGKPFFYLADTVWTAMSNPSFEEWEEYLDYRKMQGFNAVQINVLTQWDAGNPDTVSYPFQVDQNGKFNFYSINEEYFRRGQTILDMASKKGFTPVLVVLWGNYVKDTWMSDNDPANIMPLELVEPYTEYIVKMFSPYNPVYMAGGDTNFGSEYAVRYYLTVLKTIKRLTPEALTTIHLGGCLAEIPETLLNSTAYDFYVYQSSHGIESQDAAYKLAEDFYGKPVKRPIINAEPCYEGHYFGGKYGRYNEFYVRKAIWGSLLSGAKAGITYGAHGVWGWYRDDKEFSNESYGGRPLHWRTALRFKGAWDAAFARWIFENYGLHDLGPKDAILNETREIRMSVSRDSSKVVLYIPYNTDVKVNMNLSGYDWTLINLTDKLFARPIIKYENGLSTIKMHDFNSDVLILGMK